MTPQRYSPNGEFFREQCGNYDPATQQGYISGPQLKFNVEQHEAGFFNGHYAFYLAAQSLPSNNLGIAAKAVVGGAAHANSTGFIEVDVNEILDRLAENTAAAARWRHAEDARNAIPACEFRGHIRWPPYANSCQ